jgi:uncharacterized protein YjaZ
MNALTTEAVTLHVMDAGRALGSWCDRIRAEFEPAIHAISRHLEVRHVDVIAYASESVIPELGMNAYTEHAHLIRFWLDPSHPNLAQSFEVSFPALLAHELHHLVRERGPGYGRTLRDSLISEGLACQFEKEVTGKIPIYGAEIATGEVAERLARIAPFLDGPYSPGWMFGSHDQGIERSFGYQLGSSLVAQWLKRQGKTAAQAVHITTQEIAHGW